MSYNERWERREPLRFGTSGIRGVVGTELTEDGCLCVGRALGTLLGQGACVCLGRDTRRTGSTVARWVLKGLSSSGLEIVDYGIIPTPALAALTRAGGFSAGVMITASHNPPEYNGIKLFDSEGIGFSRAQELGVERLVAERRFVSGCGGVRRGDGTLDRYIETIPVELARAAAASGMKLLVDPGNGAASGFARAMFERLGLRVVTVNDEPDGLFPGRGAEPSAAALKSTCAMVRSSEADLAACFDGDADRVVFCDREGFLGLDETVAFVAQHRVRQTCRRSLATTVETGLLPSYALEREGAVVARGKVGDVAVARLTQEMEAALGAETVGVYIFPEQGLYPDSLAAVLHLCARLREGPGVREFVAALPRLHLVKRKVSCPRAKMTDVMAKVEGVLGDALDVPADATLNRIDGLRLEAPDAWVLVRPSGTEPVVRVTAEAVEPDRADRLAARADAVVTRLVAESAETQHNGGTTA